MNVISTNNKQKSMKNIRNQCVSHTCIYQNHHLTACLIFPPIQPWIQGIVVIVNKGQNGNTLILLKCRLNCKLDIQCINFSYSIQNLNKYSLNRVRKFDLSYRKFLLLKKNLRRATTVLKMITILYSTSLISIWTLHQKNSYYNQ